MAKNPDDTEVVPPKTPKHGSRPRNSHAWRCFVAAAEVGVMPAKLVRQKLGDQIF